MQAAARLKTVIDLLADMDTSTAPVDRYLRAQFRLRRYAGSKDRASITERLFAILHQRAHFAWRMQSAAPRALVLASLLAEGLSVPDIAALFDGSSYGPAPLSAEEQEAIAAAPAPMPPDVAGEYPAWLEGELRGTFGDDLPVAMAAMQGRAGIDLRVNTLNGTRAKVQDLLRAENYVPLPTPFSPFGLRLSAGAASARLSTSSVFVNGLIEFQDEAAQIATLLCGVRAGMRVLDLAAGAGGKSLALAALMENSGEIVAHDIAPERLERLSPRAVRAGARIIKNETGPVPGPFDVVLVDSPCSGSGTWRRQPELRWRLTPERLAELNQVQDGLLGRAAGLTGPGGRLVYATCSLLPCENEARIEAFLAQHPGWEIVAADTVWRGLEMGAVPPGMGRFFHAAPHSTGTDGFFTAILQAPKQG